MLTSNIKISKNRLVVLGDVHGDWNCIIDFCKNYNNVCIIQLGDFGLGFYHPTKENHRLKELSKHLHNAQNELIAIRGNHDNPTYFHNKLVGDSLFLLNDYSLLKFNNKMIQLVGGGISIDRQEREIGRSWWADESVSFCPERIEKVDILLTHVGPTNFPFSNPELSPLVNYYHRTEMMLGNNLLQELKDEIETMQKISDLSECKSHYFGHYHMHNSIDVNGRNYYCLDVNEFKEIQ